MKSMVQHSLLRHSLAPSSGAMPLLQRIYNTLYFKLPYTSIIKTSAITHFFF